ncbi:hypothetical protein F511_18000 [Dorcoceras hygrometricum]|uniref:Uncharacterized protein n=1 Tax=Dorcoceras hygrometricum TaxID=472368 RepID=A0A2Z7DKW2_9LAMI|nr:hypothetical protein F511_18000 [Dorcoceras hygrometricum]
MTDKRELCGPWLPSTDLGPVLSEMQRHATPCATITHGGRPAGATPVGQRAAAASSYSAHRSARGVQLQRTVRWRHTLCVATAHSALAPRAVRSWLRPVSQENWHFQRLATVVLRIRSTTGNTTPSSVCTRRADEFSTNGIFSSRWSERVQPRQAEQGGGRRVAQGRRPRGVVEREGAASV